VAAAAGFEVMPDTEDDELDFSQFENESAVSDPRVDQLEAEFNAYKQAQEEQAVMQEIESFTEQEMTRLGIANEVEQRAVLSIAATLDLDREGFPQIEEANRMLEDLYGSKQKEWIGSKKASRPPLQGQAAEETFDFSNEDERRKYLASLIEASE
jgi:hypothetical protein